MMIILVCIRNGSHLQPTRPINKNMEKIQIHAETFGFDAIWGFKEFGLS